MVLSQLAVSIWALVVNWDADGQCDNHQLGTFLIVNIVLPGAYVAGLLVVVGVSFLVGLLVALCTNKRALPIVM